MPLSTSAFGSLPKSSHHFLPSHTSHGPTNNFINIRRQHFEYVVDRHTDRQTDRQTDERTHVIINLDNEDLPCTYRMKEETCGYAIQASKCLVQILAHF